MKKNRLKWHFFEFFDILDKSWNFKKAASSLELNRRDKNSLQKLQIYIPETTTCSRRLKCNVLTV